MLQLTLSLFFYYQFVNCDMMDVVNNTDEMFPQNFNETLLSLRLHKSQVQANAFFKKINHKPAYVKDGLRSNDNPVDPIAPTEENFMDYSVTDIWWSGERKTVGITEQTSFMPTPKGFGMKEFDKTRHTEPAAFPKIIRESNPTATEPHNIQPDDPQATPPNPPKLHSNFSDIPDVSEKDQNSKAPVTESGIPEHSIHGPLAIEGLHDKESEKPQSTISLPFTTLHPKIAELVMEYYKSHYMNTSEMPTWRNGSQTFYWEYTTGKYASPEYDSFLPDAPNEEPAPSPFLKSQGRQGPEQIFEKLWPSPSTTTTEKPYTYTTELIHSTYTVPSTAVIGYDPEGYMVVQGTPTVPPGMQTTIIDGVLHEFPAEINTVALTPTTAGAVIMGHTQDPEPVDTYKEELYTEMDTYKIGYMSVFLNRLTKVASVKDPKELSKIFFWFETIFNKYLNLGWFAYFEQPLTTVVMNIAVAISGAPIDALQSYAEMVHRLLVNRNLMVDKDLLKMIENYDLLFEENEAQELLDILKDFETFPNTSRSDFEIAENLVIKFLQPIERLSLEKKFKLIDEVNRALIKRFPGLPKHPRYTRRSGEVFRARSGEVFKQVRIKRLKYDPEVQTPSTQPSRPKPRGRRRRLQKPILPEDEVLLNFNRKRRSRIIERRNQKRITPRHPDFNYERIIRKNYYLPGESKEIDVTTFSYNFKKRFNIIDPKNVENVNTKDDIHKNKPNTDKVQQKHTEANHRIVYFETHTIPVEAKEKSISNKLKKIFLQPKRDQKRNLPTLKTPYPNLFMSRENVDYFKGKSSTKGLRLKIDSVRKFMSSDSSYSDEEEALKTNLISALIHQNNTRRTVNKIKENHWAQRAR